MSQYQGGLVFSMPMISNFYCVKGETIEAAKHASSRLAFNIPPPFLYFFPQEPIGWGATLWSDRGCSRVCAVGTAAQSKAELPLCHTLFLLSVVPLVAWHKVPASSLAAWIDFTAHTQVSAVRIRLLSITSAFKFTVLAADQVTLHIYFNWLT